MPEKDIHNHSGYLHENQQVIQVKYFNPSCFDATAIATTITATIPKATATCSFMYLNIERPHNP